MLDYALANLNYLMRQVVTNGSMNLIEPRGGRPLWTDDAALIDPLPAIDGGRLVMRPSIRGGGNNAQSIGTMWPSFYRALPRSDMVGTQTGSYATRRKTVEYAFPTKITGLATANTIAGATRYDTSSITIYIPETSSRVFLSVRLVATYHTEYAASNSVLGWLLGANLGGVANDKISDGFAALSTANKNLFDTVDMDFTSRFNNSFGSGTSQTCIGSIAVRTTNADNINNVTLKLVITYEYNAREAVATRLKTIRIPIQSQSGTLTASQLELGVDGNGPCPSNQIPALDTFLPEASKTYRAIFLELFAQTNAITAVDFTPFIQIDAVAEVALATVQESVFSTEMEWRTIYDLSGLDTSVVHKLSMRTDLSGRLSCPGGFLVVTYEYNPSTTTSVMCEAIVPVTSPNTDYMVPEAQGYAVTRFVGYTDSPGAADTFIAQLDVQETNPVLVQSGIYVIAHINFTGSTFQYAAQGLTDSSRQTYRDYAAASVTSTFGSGNNPFVHRCDTGTGWVLRRGLNRLIIKHSPAQVAHRQYERAYAIVNYTATAPVDTDSINHPVHFYGQTFTPDPTLQNIAGGTTGTMRVPVLGSPYKISGVTLETLQRYFNNTHELTYLGINPGEYDGSGFIGGQSIPPTATSFATIATRQSFLAFTRSFNVDNLHTGKLDIEQERVIARQLENINTLELVAAWSWWITYHQMTFTVSGIVTVDGSPVAANKTVNIYAYAATPGPEDVTEFVTSTLTAMNGTGSFSVIVLDSTRTYFASYVNDGNIGRSADGVPGTSTFDITIGAAGRRFIGSPFIRRKE